MNGPLLRARGLRKTYPTARGPLDVLAGLDIDIASGEFVAILGASGSGKSTLLSLLAGLDRPTGGEILLDGERLDGRPEREMARIRREKIGFVFQAFHLVPSLTVLENVFLPSAFRDGRGNEGPARALLEKLGLSDRAEHFPDQLSGGEKQRAALARALVNQPKIVFADEPTGNLDAANARRGLDLLEANARADGRALVLVTHDVDIAARADRRLLLKNGALSSL
ncbi:MAG: ABC transporter ATP-binding protein [Elusimicrobia bacterium]|nr:ABC transporter ATP-binding protein [Elusimicrobiota bacterium]MBK7544214.1 ABC transporter ATP-binding protein [Elusimicrobiota bacterium]MBK7573736.1 ABC transporter ATP-binding protein [Elusimicrobiota bacterium]MBK7689334.1 ABC transporter ATP-binding protein [Elusimicrobiota bacterium]MBK8125880.1 ABC transporter ATP-binding protein [Elusimicrobiota bacterium]